MQWLNVERQSHRARQPYLTISRIEMGLLKDLQPGP